MSRHDSFFLRFRTAIFSVSSARVIGSLPAGGLHHGRAGIVPTKRGRGTAATFAVLRRPGGAAGDGEAAFAGCHSHRLALGDTAGEDKLGPRILRTALDHPLQ